MGCSSKFVGIDVVQASYDRPQETFVPAISTVSSLPVHKSERRDGH